MNVGFILAAGNSKRFGGDKAFAHIKGKPSIYYSLKLFEVSPHIGAVFIAANKNNKAKIELLVKREKLKKVRKVYLGGAARFESVKKGLFCLENLPCARLKIDRLVIHNAANPLASHEELEKCLDACAGKINGAAVGRPVISTIKKTDGSGIVRQTMSRENLWEMETPQVVKYKDFKKAVEQAAKTGVDFTDDLSVLEAVGMKTAVVLASAHNRKITSREDFGIARFFAGDLPQGFRVGIGEDTHRFCHPEFVSGSSKCKKSKVTLLPLDKLTAGGDRSDKKCLILGGVKIKNLPALEANSDGDVIIHALCNAISSALGGGSLGTYATKMCKRGIKDSKKYLEFILKKAARKKYKILQCSISMEAQRPNIDAVTHAIKSNLGNLLGIQASKIGITAGTGNQTAVSGCADAIKCTAAVVLFRQS